MEKKKILLVDDDKPIVRAYAEGLEQEGFKVVVAYDGQEAMKEIEKEKPDVVLLDMIMPIMNGEAVLDELEKTNILASIPVIIVTNSVKEADMVKRKNYKIAGYFVKSDTSMDKLTRKVKEVLEG